MSFGGLRDFGGLKSHLGEGGKRNGGKKDSSFVTGEGRDERRRPVLCCKIFLPLLFAIFQLSVQYIVVSCLRIAILRYASMLFHTLLAFFSLQNSLFFDVSGCMQDRLHNEMHTPHSMLLP